MGQHSGCTVWEESHALNEVNIFNESLEMFSRIIQKSYSNNNFPNFALTKKDKNDKLLGITPPVVTTCSPG